MADTKQTAENTAAKSQEEQPPTGAPPTYSGRQLIQAASGINRDILTVVLKPDQQYTDADVKALTDKFLKKEVTSDGGR